MQVKVGDVYFLKETAHVKNELEHFAKEHKDGIQRFMAKGRTVEFQRSSSNLIPFPLSRKAHVRNMKLAIATINILEMAKALCSGIEIRAN